MKKVLIWIKNHALILGLGIVFILLTILFVLPIFPKKLSEKVLKKIKNTKDTIIENQKTTAVAKKEIEVIKDVHEQTIVTKKQELQKQLDQIAQIPDKRKRLNELIKFHDSIKKFK